MEIGYRRNSLWWGKILYSGVNQASKETCVYPFYPDLMFTFAHPHTWKMDLNQKIPQYLTDKKNIVRLVLFTAIFALIFINLYSPFAVNDWLLTAADRLNFQNHNLLLLISSSMIILTGVLVVVISRFTLYKVTKKFGSRTLLQFLAWIAVEIFFMALFYALYERIFLEDQRTFVQAFKVSLQNTALVLLLPYSISWLYLSWIDKNRQLEKIKEGPELISDLNEMVVFHDEKGTMRLSLKLSDLLYLQAADNYVNIIYNHHQKLAKYMLRSSLKLIEKEHQGLPLVRCHRSYMVNFEKVKIIRREKEGLIIELDSDPTTEIAVSKTYMADVFKAFDRSYDQ